MTIIEDWAVLSGMKRLYADQQRQIDALVKSQEELNRRIHAASAIREITKDGVALTATVASLKRAGGYASTVTDQAGDERRTVDVYKKQGASQKGWAVSINAREGLKETFYGGKALGLSAE